MRRPAARESRDLKPDRIDNPTIVELAQILADGAYERLLLCEGDSWFDIFTPAPLHEPNLLDALRLPRRALLVDVSHVGDTAKEMATDPQAANTVHLLNEFKFDALLLSAGGNDLKNAFKEMFVQMMALRKKGMRVPYDLAAMTAHPSTANSIFEEVVGYIASWIGLRGKSKLNRDTPVVLHGYDYLQPRPAYARLFINGPRISGPWVHPILCAAGKTDEQMRDIAKEVIDTLNALLARRIGPLPNVRLLDTRGTLKLAKPGTDRASSDWMDEIHALPEGWAKLAERAWNPILRTILA